MKYNGELVNFAHNSEGIIDINKASEPKTSSVQPAIDIIANKTSNSITSVNNFINTKDEMHAVEAHMIRNKLLLNNNVRRFTNLTTKEEIIVDSLAGLPASIPADNINVSNIQEIQPSSEAGEKDDDTDRQLINSRTSSVATNDKRVIMPDGPLSRRRRTRYYHPELRFIKEILKQENSPPDQVVVSAMFNNYRIAEFIAALFTLISILSGVFYFEIDIARNSDPYFYIPSQVKDARLAALYVMNISTLLYCKVL
jgi:hypothetical protein